MEKTLNINSASEIYDVSKRTLRNLCAQNKIKAIKLNGKGWIIPVIELDRLFHVQSPGYETLCKATDCMYNDRPVCGIHTQNSPIILGFRGNCLNYRKK